MKKFLILICLLTLLGCKGAYKTTSGGKEDVGFLSVVGDVEKYSGGILVTVDNGKPIIATVDIDGKIIKEDNRVKIPAGKHKITMTYQGRVLIQQDMMFFAQETKKITLP